MTQTVNSGEQCEKVNDSNKLPSHGRFSAVGVVFSIFAFVLLCALVAFGAIPRLVQQKQLASHTQSMLAQDVPVSVTIAQPGADTQEFILPGSTQAIQDALIYARVNGYIRSRYVDIGDRVHAGQILAYIDTPELDKQVQAAESAVKQAQSSLENTREALAKAEADLKTAEANTRKAITDLAFYTLEVGRYKRLSDLGAVSLEDSDSRTQAYQAGQANLEAMKAATRSSQAGVNSAKAAVRVANAALDAAQAQCEQYEATRSFKKVRALFDGIVTQRNVDAGALVTSGSNSTNTVLFEIAKTDVLRIFVYVPEQYVPYIQNGEKALINVQEYPGAKFAGKVTHVAGGLDPTSKTLQVEIHVQNASHKLLPGMYARVCFQAPTRFRPVILPATCVKTRAEGCFVYTVDSKKKVHLHKIEIGRDLGGLFEITSGINAGDKAIVSPADDIHDGLEVKPVLAPQAEKPESN